MSDDWQLPLLIGFVAGLRAMLAPAAVAWSVHLRGDDVAGTWLAFLDDVWTRGMLTVLALAELVTDKLPFTPRRTVPVQFGTRIVAGAVAGGAVGTLVGVDGLVPGVVGALGGTLGGRSLRARLAAAFGDDRPAALVEDALAIGCALLVALAMERARGA